MIYAIWAKQTDFVKFGWVKTEKGIKRRLVFLQCGCPHELQVLAMVEGTLEDEGAIHEMLKRQHVRGEWFHINSDVRQVLAQMLDGKAFSEWKFNAHAPANLRRVHWWANNRANAAHKSLLIRTRKSGEVWTYRAWKPRKVANA